MTRLRLSHDMIAAALLTIGGLAIAAFAATSYGLGSLRMIGPAAFPIGVGLLMALLGLLIGLSDHFKRVERPSGEAIRWQDLLRTCAAVLAFALLIRPFGAIPAVFALSFISMATRERKTWAHAAIVASCVSAGAIALFQHALGLRFTALGWPL